MQLLQNLGLLPSNDDDLWEKLGPKGEEFFQMPADYPEDDKPLYADQVTNGLNNLEVAIEDAMTMDKEVNPLNDSRIFGIADDLIQKYNRFEPKDIDIAGKRRDELITLIADGLHLPAQTQEKTKRWSKQFDQNRTRESANFQRMEPGLRAKYGVGHFVALSDGKEVGHGTDELKLAEQMSAQFPDQFVLIERITSGKAAGKGC